MVKRQPFDDASAPTTLTKRPHTTCSRGRIVWIGEVGGLGEDDSDERSKTQQGEKPPLTPENVM